MVRAPAGPYGWLDARLLRDGWLARLGPDAVAVMAFLTLAADRAGVSFYGRDRIAVALDLDRGRLDVALRLLLAEGLLAFRPWRAGGADGVWQLLPVPAAITRRRAGGPAPVGDLLAELLRRRP